MVPLFRAVVKSMFYTAVKHSIHLASRPYYYYKHSKNRLNDVKICVLYCEVATVNLQLNGAGGGER